MTRGWPLKSSTCVAGSGCAASGPVIAAPNAPSHKTRTDLISPLYDIRGGAMHGLETLARRPLPAGMSNTLFVRLAHESIPVVGREEIPVLAEDNLRPEQNVNEM